MPSIDVTKPEERFNFEWLARRFRRWANIMDPPPPPTEPTAYLELIETADLVEEIQKRTDESIIWTSTQRTGNGDSNIKLCYDIDFSHLAETLQHIGYMVINREVEKRRNNESHG